MVRHLLNTSAALTLLVSLFLFGCQSGRSNSGVPGGTTQGDNSFNPSTGSGTGNAGDLLPSGGSPAGQNTNLPGLPGGSTPSDNNNGGLNVDPNANLTQIGNQAASAWQSIFNQVGSFDPRQTPQPAQTAYNSFMCALARANFAQILIRNVSLANVAASYYVNVLGRAPESQEAIQYHVARLRESLRGGVRGFIMSDEKRQQLARGSYRYFFGPQRNVAQSEVDYWANYLAGHNDQPGGAVTLEEMYTGFLASPEYWSNVAGRSNQAFVINAYRYALGRNPESAGYNHWLHGRNFAVQSTRTAVARAFFTSDEYRLRKTGHMVRRYLGIPVSGDELAYRLSNYHAGRDQLMQMADILTDDRYLARQGTLWDPFLQRALSGQCQ